METLYPSYEGKETRVPRAQPDLWSMGILPVLVLGAFSGVLGVYWDIAWHLDKGRDSFFSPPHNFIYSAMIIILLVGAYALFRDRRETPMHLRWGRLRVQPGIVIVCLGAAITLFFAPADDLWHRIYGEDVTLWAPMHLLGLFGLILGLLGALVAAWTEGLLQPEKSKFYRRLTVVLGGGLLVWSMLLLAEYEYSVPAFPLWMHVMFLTGLPTLVLVLMARLRPLAWAATLSALLFMALRLLLAAWLLVSDSWFDWAGATRPMLPLLIFGALAADLLRARHVALLGLLIGLLNFGVNWGLIAVTATLNWHPQAIAWGLPSGLALSLGMAWLGAAAARALYVAAPEEARP